MPQEAERSTVIAAKQAASESSSFRKLAADTLPDNPLTGVHEYADKHIAAADKEVAKLPVHDAEVMARKNAASAEEHRQMRRARVDTKYGK